MTKDKKALERLKAELGEWRTSLDNLRVQANLGRKEARDKLHALDERMGPAFRKAKRALDDIATSGTDEARALGKSLRAGWEELRRTHRELSREAEQERSDQRRHTGD